MGSTEADPAHVYARSGAYTVTLTTTDHALQTATTSTTVTVGSIPLVDAAHVVVDGQTLAVSGTAAAEVVNPAATALGPFTVVFFEDTNGNGHLDAGTDTVLGQVPHTGLALGANVRLSAPVTGTVTFRTPPLMAFLDTGNPSTLTDPHVYGSSGQSCTRPPSTGALQPVLKWQWTGSPVLSNSHQVMMAPAVMDLNNDGIPDVVFVTFPRSNNFGAGTLRAVSGDDGHELFTVTSHTLSSFAGVAVGDLDGDGHPEIVTVDLGDGSGSRLLAFTHTGIFKWRSPLMPRVPGATPALADIDQDGISEIVLGDKVFNHDGTLRWVGGKGTGDNIDRVGPISLVANLDLTGHAEIVAGNTTYRADGSVYWHRPELPDGFNALGNFDTDPYPEIVLVANGYVYLLEHDGTVKWGPVPLPGSRSANAGGPPLVADVDGDGIPEIGVAGATFYTVLRADGSILWSRPVRDASSYVTGSSAFDFDGDGTTEILYGDELTLRIYRGSDGTVLWEPPSGNGTIYEYPLVVDVDGDGHADILKVSNDYAFGTKRGLQVYHDAQNSWVPTRRMWNQHTYHITNVHDNGTIPRLEVPSWRTHNSYRRNLPVNGLPVAFPDLVASYLRVFPTAGGAQLTARLGNSGAVAAPASVPVAFYAGDPQAGGTLLGTVSTTAPLLPGAFVDLTLPVTVTTSLPVWVVADDPGNRTSTVPECNETNNTHNSGLVVRSNTPPIARAGGPYTGTEGTPVLLNGTGSTDAEGDALTYAWDLGGAGVVSAATSASPTATFPDNGTFAITLRVSDGRATHSATTTVTITNVVPQVSLGATATVDAGTPFLQTGSWHDPGTDTWTATVDYGDGTGIQPLALGPDHTFAVQHVYPDSGSYTLTVTLQDKDGGQGHASLLVTVRAVQHPPVAHAGGPYTVEAGSPLTLDGTGSSDPDGEPLLYAWDFDHDGAFDDATGATPTATFPRPGTFPVAVQVSDGVLTQTATTTVTVLNVVPVLSLPPLAPVAVGTPLAQTGTVVDPGDNTWTATVDYGDGSGPQPLTLASDQSFVLAHTYTVPGTYTVTVTVQDNYGGVGQVTGTVRVFQPNRAPLARVSGPSSVAEGILATLDGSASSDPDGDPLTYTWTLLAGPAVVLDLRDPVRPTFLAPTVPPSGATLTLQLTVSDGTLTSTPALFTLAISNVNHPPVAQAGPAQTVQAGSLVQLDGAGSFDADGDPLTFEWSQRSGPLVTLSDAAVARPVFTAPAGSATRTFALTVSDGLASASATVTIIVESINHPPVAHAGTAQTRDEGALVTLDGRASTDPDGDPLQWQWSQSAGPQVTLQAATSATPTFTAPLVGPSGATLVFALRVSDGLLTSPPAPVTVTVRHPNAPPLCALAQAAPARLWPPNHRLVAVTLRGITDPDGPAPTVTLTAVRQDEPVNGLGDGDTSPDTVLQGASVLLRAERAGGGNGRVYHLTFTADDGQVDGRCTGTVTVCVPHSAQAPCTDEGPQYDATRPN